MGEFDDYWARAYRGDSGVPHSDPQRLVSTWTGAFALGAAACVHHHASALATSLKSLPHRLARHDNDARSKALEENPREEETESISLSNTQTLPDDELLNLGASSFTDKFRTFGLLPWC
ncbi:hypothetical protein ACP4OV_012412 [Aristida adscensionis]